MKLIALEEHFLVDQVHEVLAHFPAPYCGLSVDFADQSLTEKLRDLADTRLRYMDSAGVDTQVLSLVAPGVQSMTAADAVPLAQVANDLAAEAVRAHPDRLQFLAALPRPDPVAAVAELEHGILQLGAQGAVVFARTGVLALDHPDLAPVLAAAERLRAPLYLHPQSLPVAVRQAYGAGLDPQVGDMLVTAGVGWHYDTGIARMRLILRVPSTATPSCRSSSGIGASWCCSTWTASGCWTTPPRSSTAGRITLGHAIPRRFRSRPPRNSVSGY